MSGVTGYYSTQEAALKLGKSRQQVYLDCRLGKIPSEKFGRAYFIEKKIIDKMVKAKH